MVAIPNEQRRNYVVKITTPFGTFRWTPSRARRSDGGIGLIVGGETYSKENVTVPTIALSAESSAPEDVTLLVGMADNEKDDFIFDSSVLRSLVVVQRVRFTATWTVESVQPWFSGEIGRTWASGETLTIECYRESGRRRGTGARDSQSLMQRHTPPSKIPIIE